MPSALANPRLQAFRALLPKASFAPANPVNGAFLASLLHAPFTIHNRGSGFSGIPAEGPFCICSISFPYRRVVWTKPGCCHSHLDHPGLCERTKSSEIMPPMPCGIVTMMASAVSFCPLSRRRPGTSGSWLPRPLSRPLEALLALLPPLAIELCPAWLRPFMSELLLPASLRRSRPCRRPPCLRKFCAAPCEKVFKASRHCCCFRVPLHFLQLWGSFREFALQGAMQRERQSRRDSRTNSDAVCRKALQS